MGRRTNLYKNKVPPSQSRKSISEILDGIGRKVSSPQPRAQLQEAQPNVPTVWKPRPLAEIVSGDQSEVEVSGTGHGSHYMGKDPYDIIRKMPSVGPGECKSHYPEGSAYLEICEELGSGVWTDCARACLINKLPKGLSPEHWDDLSVENIRWLLISHPHCWVSCI